MSCSHCKCDALTLSNLQNWMVSTNFGRVICSWKPVNIISERKYCTCLRQYMPDFTQCTQRAYRESFPAVTCPKSAVDRAERDYNAWARQHRRLIAYKREIRVRLAGSQVTQHLWTCMWSCCAKTVLTVSVFEVSWDRPSPYCGRSPNPC